MSGKAFVVGAGPNGLAAAIVMAQAGVDVTVFEAKETIGGGCRTRELTLPGFRHDVCAAVHPLAAGSPFLRSLPLGRHGLEWLQPETALAHPFDDGSAVSIRRSLDETARILGPDGAAYRSLIGPLASQWDALAGEILGPLLHRPGNPLLLARFGLKGLRSAAGLARSAFGDPRTRALFCGVAAHANLPLSAPLTAGFGLVLCAAAHAGGWPMAKGGSQALVEALAAHLRSLGGRIETGRRVASLAGLPDDAVVLLDVTPRQLIDIAGERLSGGYRRRLRRFRYGAAAFKVDYALRGPVPWRAADCGPAGTVHLAGSMEEMMAAAADVAAGRAPARPFVIAAQQSVFDPTRAPAGMHTLWAYCQVPSGCDFDMTGRVEAQIERFAPGFRDLVLAREVMSPAGMEAYNENYAGGDIAGGSPGGLQLFFRPVAGASPYATSDPRVFICSSSTPPGAGTHGMCGYHAARAALRSLARRRG